MLMVNVQNITRPAGKSFLAVLAAVAKTAAASCAGGRRSRSVLPSQLRQVLLTHIF
jgi:hypothetical protein